MVEKSKTKKETEKLTCDICKMSISPKLQFTAPEAIIDNREHRPKVYTICGGCQYLLHLGPSPQGIQIGTGLELDRVKELIYWRAERGL